LGEKLIGESLIGKTFHSSACLKELVFDLKLVMKSTEKLVLSIT
jgi:hypothetical protein